MIQKIISGGQTGADRAALDFAIEHNIPYGGWVPKGRKTEDGTLPDRYDLQEMPTDEYLKRTEQNILNSDGTLIISNGRLTGGSALTEFLTCMHNMPYFHVDMDQINLAEAAAKTRQWIKDNGIKILNVAGARASKDSEIYRVTIDLLEATFRW